MNVLSIRNFRWLAAVEAVSFLVLLYFSVINRDEGLVRILGSLHGLLFVLYVVSAWLLRKRAEWTDSQTLLILLGAVLPFGGFVVDWWLARRHPRHT